MAKKDGCDDCLQFGILNTKLSDLTKGLSIFFLILTGLLAWGGKELYSMNRNLGSISIIERRLDNIEKEVTYYEFNQEKKSDRVRRVVNRLEDYM